MSNTRIEQLLNPARLSLLLKRELAHGYRGFLITMAAVGAFIVASSLLSMVATPEPDSYLPGFTLLLFVGGFIYTARSFRDLAEPVSGQFYLMLPGSALEKLLSKLLASTVGFALWALLFYSAAANITELLSLLIFGAGHGFFNPFSAVVLRPVLYYLVLQSVFLLGSIWFKKAALVKTTLAAAVLFIGLFLFAGLLFCLLFGVPAPGPQTSLLVNRFFTEHKEELSSMLDPLVPILFWAGFAPVCWVITYLRLRETEV
jgi:hypothetical protein